MSNRQQRKQNKMYRKMSRAQEHGFHDYLLGTTLHIDEQVIPHIATSIDQLPKVLQDKWKQLDE